MVLGAIDVKDERSLRVQTKKELIFHPVVLGAKDVKAERSLSSSTSSEG